MAHMIATSANPNPAISAHSPRLQTQSQAQRMRFVLQEWGEKVFWDAKAEGNPVSP